MVTLQQMLEKIKETPISLETMRSKLPPRCKAVLYTSLRAHRSQVFKGVDSVVVLIPKKGESLGHFVVLTAKRNHIEYFSSLGGTFEQELAKLNEPLNIMRELLGKNYITNSVKLQSGAYAVEDCAIWVLLRCYMNSLKLREFQQLFTRRVTLQSSDDIAALMGLLLLVDI